MLLCGRRRPSGRGRAWGVGRRSLPGPNSGVGRRRVFGAGGRSRHLFRPPLPRLPPPPPFPSLHVPTTAHPPPTPAPLSSPHHLSLSLSLSLPPPCPRRPHTRTIDNAKQNKTAQEGIQEVHRRRRGPTPTRGDDPSDTQDDEGCASGEAQAVARRGGSGGRRDGGHVGHARGIGGGQHARRGGGRAGGLR